jgi:hypothetical protein
MSDFQYTYRAYDITSFENDVADLLDVRDKELEYYLKSSGSADWPYEFSYPGALAVNTSPAILVRRARNITVLAMNILGSGSADISIRVNTTAVQTVTLTANTVVSVNLSFAENDLVTASVDTISTAGLSNLWVGAY